MWTKDRPFIKKATILDILSLKRHCKTSSHTCFYLRHGKIHVIGCCDCMGGDKAKNFYFALDELEKLKQEARLVRK